ncbi:hypothetical protein AXH23_14345 [Acinetobacter pittii]|uniref:hypothetical protein n=1 Tax=Acinetobacter pittii TaxID=48296 RepID=UPI00083FB7CB|nr:hypothetical protein [Acinetobacter pittii]ODL91702.1 hypothetical protein AXH23_14345 [Acinetobacter pittii]
MKHKLIFIFSIIFILTGCGKKYTITPEDLPVAHINQEYQQIIKISGGKVIDKYAELETNIPEDLGITVKPVDDLDGYNVIQIKGTPKNKGKYTIHIRADFYAGGDAEIDKTYSFIVQD